jgi:hypothetical protein
MLTVDQYEYIRIAHRVYDKGIRQIARETGHSRNTGTRIYNRLKNEKGYQGSIATVLRYVRIARQRIGIGGRQVFIPLDPPVGQGYKYGDFQ